ncbi:MAG: ATP-binding protein, partial [Desulfomonilia bacterium]|nr:ATP-binding protein [Desulfomonilia bacterium]
GLSPQMASLEKLIQDVQTERSPQFLHEQTLSEKSPRFFDISIYPLMNPTHGGVVFTAVDITEKKHMELQLIHAQKMETIGELAGGVAHDFNNILTGLSGNISMLKYTKDATKQQHYIQTLENITDRARDLIQQMLVFTKRHEGRPAHIPIKGVLHDVLDMTSKSFPKHIRMEITGDSKEYIVFLDRTHLTQVFLNLVVNAKDAIGNKQDGTISIDISSFVADKNSKRQYLLGSLGKYVKIDIRDNGCGMNDEILSKVFNPFFTTKQKGTVKGTGLGLSIAYNIVKNAGGSIHVQSEEGRGTIFSVLIPVSGQKHASLSPDDRIKHSLSKQSARILIVDDEDMLREIGKEMLNLLGHSVETVSNGRECIEVLSKDSKRFDLVILDMIMPDLDGYHTLQEMQKQNINTKVIISSGYSFEHEQGDILANPLIIAKLNKPFNMKELSEVLEDALS